MDSYEIKFLNGELAGKTIPLGSGASLLGRARDAVCGFSNDLKVSSRHCQITVDERGCYIEDVASRNGTFVNNNRISQRESLKSGDIILIGSTSIEFSATRESPADFSASPAEYLAAHPMEDDTFPTKSPEPEAPSQSPSPASDEVVQCRLRQTSGGESSRLCWIRLDQSMVIGRNETVDYSFPDDFQMSGKHFLVTLRPDGCVIEDLKSENGTWVNGVSVDRCALVHGAKIQAGATHFNVEISGIDWANPPASIPATPPPPEDSLKHSVIHAKMVANREQFASGLVRIQGKWDQEPLPVEWIQRLLPQKGNVYLLIDFGRLSMEAPEVDQNDACSLFDWLPLFALKNTPCLFDLRIWKQWPAAVEEAWGSDAMMILSSPKSKQEILDSLRKMVRGNGGSYSIPHSIQGICWPSVLRPLLEVEATGFAKEYFSVIEAVMMEGLDDPLTWDWIGQPAILDPMCKSIRIQLQDMSEAKTI